MSETDAVHVFRLPADILAAAESALDNMLCNCRESCGTTDAMRKASIEDIGRALFAERLQGDAVCDSYAAENQRLFDRATAAQSRIEVLEEALRPFAHIAEHFPPENGWAETDEILLSFEDARLAEITMSCFFAARSLLLPSEGQGHG